MAKLSTINTTKTKSSKGTSIGSGRIKTATMNKSKRRNYKKYRGQGR